MYNTIPNNPFPPSSASAGGGEPYVLPVASADTLGGVKVGARLSIANGVLSADKQLSDYSTTEQATGQKWIDGKEIFRNVIVLDSATIFKNNDWVAIPFSGNNFFAIVNAFAIGADGSFCPLVVGRDGANTVVLACRVDSSFTATTVVVEYVKQNEESEG